jgi:hypothetical protein
MRVDAIRRSLGEWVRSEALSRLATAGYWQANVCVWTVFAAFLSGLGQGGPSLPLKAEYWGTGSLALLAALAGGISGRGFPASYGAGTRWFFAGTCVFLSPLALALVVLSVRSQLGA